MSKLPNRFACVVEASGLVSAEKLTECLALLGDQVTDDRLADLLLRRGLLTKWQLTELKAGRADAVFLGQYVFLELLGSGGMGRVFQARDQKTGRQVAIKLLPKGRVTQKAIERLRREGQAALALQHENIVHTFEVGQEADTPFLVMELVEGVDLAKHLLKHGKLSAKETARIGYEVAQALDHAWQNGLIHRDIKPTNIMLTSDGRVKLLDLGIAKFVRSDQDRPATLTQTGAIMGTMDYMAPEQAEDGKRADCRSDLYSLGCTLYQCLTGKVPFPNGTVVQKIVAHRQSDPPSIIGLNSDVPQALADLIEKRMLAKHPDDRFQTPAEAADALNPWPFGNSQVIDATQRQQKQPTETTTNRFEPGALLRAKPESTERGEPHRQKFLRGRYAMLIIALVCVLIGWGFGRSWSLNPIATGPQPSGSSIAGNESVGSLNMIEPAHATADADEQSQFARDDSRDSTIVQDVTPRRLPGKPVADDPLTEDQILPKDNAVASDLFQPKVVDGKVKDPANQRVAEKTDESVPAKPDINVDVKTNNGQRQDKEIEVSPEVAATVRKLMLQLDSKDAAAREQAAKQLRVFGPQAKDAVPALINALRRDEDHGLSGPFGGISESPVKRECTAALVSIGRSAIPMLIEGLADNEKRRRGYLLVDNRREVTDTLSQFCAVALSRIGSDAVPALVEVERTGKSSVKELVLWTLSEIEPIDATAVQLAALILKQDKADFNRAYAWRVLHRADPVATAKLLTEILERSSDLKPRTEIVEGLSYLQRDGYSVIVAPLKECVPAFFDVYCRVDRNNRIYYQYRSLAWSGLNAIGKQRIECDDSAFASMIESLNGRDIQVLRDSAELLQSFGSEAKPVVRSLIELLSHQDILVRLKSAKALGKIGASSKPALPTLESLTKDPSPSVRTEAQSAIKAINSAIAQESRNALENAANKKATAEM